MFGKNPFRTFLYILVSMVLVKLCYNLGYGAASKKLSPAQQKTRRSQAYGLPGMSPEDADTTNVADTAEVRSMPTPGQ
ncbi:hypothetical protein [Hymenobacter sp. UYCo722]|uniref:hypothetical protein n=1 Tax=Hymenobacter sp. UYCo722 TaxID=3156335 RepID=UPI003393856D